jgi:hypothetical protein
MRKNETRDFERVVAQKTEDSKYEPPRIKTYTSEEILEQIGPAMACSPTECPGN